MGNERLNPFYELLLLFSHSVVSESLRPMDCSTAGFPVLHNVLEFAKTHVHWVNDAIHLSYPLLPSSPPALNLSQLQVFSSELALCIMWPKYWSFSFSISLSNEYSGFISLGLTDLIFLLSKGLKSLLQLHSSKASVLHVSAFFFIQLSHPYMTTRKTIALTIQTFVGKVMSLHFNMLSRFVIAFLPRRKHLLISRLQSPSAAILELNKIKFVTASILSSSVCREVMGLGAMILGFWMLSFKPAFSLSSFTFIKRLFMSSLLSAIMVVSSMYLRLLVLFLAILIPACASSNLIFCMV